MSKKQSKDTTDIRIIQTKKDLIKALENSLGVVTTACKIVGITRRTYYNYYNDDKQFRDTVDNISEFALDFVESKLLEQIKDNNTTATIFYLKTKGKHRGYVQTQQVHQITEHRNYDKQLPEYDLTKLDSDEAVKFYDMLEKMERPQIEETISEVEVIDDDDIDEDEEI